MKTKLKANHGDRDADRPDKGRVPRIIAICVLAVLALFSVVYRLQFSYWPIIGHGDKQAVVKPDTVFPIPGDPQATSLQIIRDALGPWQIRTDQTPVGSSASQLVMLMQTGSVDVSSVSVQFVPAEWQSTRSGQIKEVHIIDGLVQVTTTDSKSFQIAPQQAFIIEQEPSQTYVVTSDGTVWSTSTNQLKHS